MLARTEGRSTANKCGTSRMLSAATALLLALLSVLPSADSVQLYCNGQPVSPIPSGSATYIVVVDRSVLLDVVVAEMESVSEPGGRRFTLGSTYTSINGFSAVMNGPAISYLLDQFADSLQHVECDSAMEAFAESKFYCEEQEAGEVAAEAAEPVIISVAGEAALGAAESAVPEVEFALLPTSTLGTFLSANLNPAQATHLLSTLGKSVHYITCDSNVTAADVVDGPSIPSLYIRCGSDVIQPTDGEYVVAFNDDNKNRPTEADIRAMVSWLQAEGGPKFFTLSKMHTGGLVQFVSGTFSAEALQALVTSEHTGIIRSIRCEEEVMARVRCGEEVMTETQAGEGLQNYLVQVGGGPTATKEVVAIVSWLAEAYNASEEVGSIQSHLSNGLLDPYLEAEMTWEVIEALLASHLGAFVTEIQCDQRVDALGPGLGGVGGGVVGDDDAVLDMVRCNNERMEPPEVATPYLVRLSSSDTSFDPRAKLSEVVAWLAEQYGHSSADLDGTPSQHPNSLAGPYFTARLSRAAVEGLLQTHGAALADVTCDQTAGSSSGSGSGGSGVGAGPVVTEVGSERLDGKVRCGGKEMEPVEGVSPFILQLNATSVAEGDMQGVMTAIADWLVAEYEGTSDMGAPPSSDPARANTLTTELSWSALRALFASEHAAALSYAECDSDLGIPDAVDPSPMPEEQPSSALGEEDLQLLQTLLSNKLNCHGTTATELPEDDTTYIVLLESDIALSPSDLVDWLTTNYGNAVNNLTSSSQLLHIVRGRLSREAAQTMLLEFRDSIRRLDCEYPASVVSVSGKSRDNASDEDNSAAAPIQRFPMAMALLSTIVGVILAPSFV